MDRRSSPHIVLAFLALALVIFGAQAGLSTWLLVLTGLAAAWNAVIVVAGRLAPREPE